MSTTVIVLSGLCLFLGLTLFLVLSSVSAIAGRIKSLELDKQEIVRQVQSESAKTTTLMEALGLLTPPASAPEVPGMAFLSPGITSSLGNVASGISRTASDIRNRIAASFGASNVNERLARIEQALTQTRGVADAAAETATAARASSRAALDNAATHDPNRNGQITSLQARVETVEQAVQLLQQAVTDNSRRDGEVQLYVQVTNDLLRKTLQDVAALRAATAPSMSMFPPPPVDLPGPPPVPKGA